MISKRQVESRRFVATEDMNLAFKEGLVGPG